MPVLDRTTNDDLLARYAADRDPRTLEELTRRYRPLARRLALRYARGPEPIDDLEQVALLGLVKALRRFDPARGFAFTSFAVPTILGELKRWFRSTAWTARVPRSLQERVAEVRSFTEEHSARRGRPPTAEDIANGIGCSGEEVAEALQAATALDPVSLDAPYGDDEGRFDTLVERLGDLEAGYERVEDREAVAMLLPLLPREQLTILHLRFAHGLKQSEIAERLGVSQMSISRQLRAALTTLSTTATHRSTLRPSTLRAVA